LSLMLVYQERSSVLIFLLSLSNLIPLLWFRQGSLHKSIWSNHKL
jgi:hypothetical protein